MSPVQSSLNVKTLIATFGRLSIVAIVICKGYLGYFPGNVIFIRKVSCSFNEPQKLGNGLSLAQSLT